MREYQKTHPWINFKCDLSRAPAALWMLMGEAQSKCQHIAAVPLKPMFQEKMNLVYLAKGVHGTAAIEGNTLTEEEVRGILEGHGDIPESKAYLEREVRNIAAAWDNVISDLESGNTKITPESLCDYNRKILDGLELNDGIVPGEVRSYSVGVLRYRCAPAVDLNYLIGRYCDWLNDQETWKPPSPDFAMGWAILKATIAHLYLAWIHPFGDGNGRTARLIELHILGQAGFPQPSMHMLSNHYNATRAEYYRQLDKASKTQDVCSFIEYALRGFVDNLRGQVGLVLLAQLSVAWENYVHEMFRDKTGDAQRRRRELAVALGSNSFTDSRSVTGEFRVSRKDIPDLTTDLARMYANKTPKTVSRDISALQKMKLIRRNRAGMVRARLEIMRGFMPWAKNGV